jgi:hypothetical protein
VALVAAAIPGRGHAFFRGWLEKLAGFLLRKAAYSLVLAILLAVNGALAAATDSLGWLMSFGLQALFFWAVFLQRKALVEGLVGIATGPRAPGREGSLRLLALYYGARSVGRPLRSLRRSGQQESSGAPARLHGGGSGSRRGGGRDGVGLAGSPPRRSDPGDSGARDAGRDRPGGRAPAGEDRGVGAPVEAGGAPTQETAGSRKPVVKGDARRGRAAEAALTSTAREASAGGAAPKGSPKRGKRQAEGPGSREASQATPTAKQRKPQTREPGGRAPVPDPARPLDAANEEGSLEADLRAERERGGKARPKSAGEERRGGSGASRPKSPRRKKSGK